MSKEYNSCYWSAEERLAYKKGCEKGEATVDERALASIAESLAELARVSSIIASALEGIEINTRKN